MMFKKSFLALMMASSLSLFANQPAQAGWDALQPANMWETIKNEVAKQEISGTVTLVNADILAGLSTSLRYKIESEPSYVEGYYTRIDKYILNFGLNPGDFIEALDSPVGMKLEKNSEIIFARQFKSQKESLLSLPYTPRNLPFTAKKAIERLVPGDFVAFQGRLSFVVSLSHDLLQGQFDAGVSTHAYVSGEFMVHLFRMPDNKMRVKLIAVRGKGVGAGAGVKLDDLEVLGFSLIDNRIEKWLNLTPLDLRAGKGKHDVIMLDYVFDLNDPAAALAYDHLMHKKVLLKDIKVANPTLSRNDLTRELLTDLTDVELIAMADAALPPSERRIDRVFKGSSEGFLKDARLKVGLTFWKFEAGRAYGENKVLSYDKKDQEQKFLLDTLSRYKKTKILFGLFGEETLVTSNLMYTSDENWNPVRFVTLTSSAEMKMRDLSEKDFKEIQRLVRDTIGHQEFNKIAWNSWDFSNGKIVNGYFKQEVFFNPEALNALPHMTPKQISALFEKYIELKGRPRSRPLVGGNSPIDYILNWTAAFTGDIRRVGVKLAVIVDVKTTAEQKFEAFEDLQQLPIWKERGIGFLMSFLSEEQRPKLLRYEMVLSGKGVPQITHYYGSFAEEKLYRSLMYIQNIINNRSFDLRLYTDEDGEFKATVRPAPLM
ncbi:hypothetical protein [Bdellovibrio reynosensis]|uniref:Uncharacterized protein n=1 Tax=Bdellovibrio reynosensis TaxID=2835041 RepID=A0ABY4C7F1_9BACT|nr:hypothetical protein [Bdellovibrio reynosensis]UOF00908.1 hypothetical protein MNR06_14495 [Bdellovibrio reynosensis]